MEESAIKHQSQRAEAEAVLRDHWGHGGFRPGQWEAIAAALDGRDVLAILPTGGGKSVCYQVPALMQEGFTLVVSPLIALMQDQVAGLKARGIAAAFINSTLSSRVIDQRWTDAEFGRYRLLYVAPERLQSELFLARAERLDVALLAVDEAHCISEWGHHFRPDYLRIPEARARLGDPPVMAVTATAPPEVRQDIIRHLDLHDPVRVVKGFDRPSLVWSIFQTEGKRQQVRRVVKRVEGSGILYAATRRATEEWAAWLRVQGESAAHYHGGMRSDEREGVQEKWIGGETRLIVATNAFGMGIDKADVRFVIHVDVPASLEAYYQEAGRAGRDGQTAYAVLLHQPSDAGTQRALIEASHPSAADVQAVYRAVCNLGQVPLGVLPDKPVPVSFDAVGRLTGFAHGKIRSALDLLERHEALQMLPRRRHRGLIRFAQSADATRRHAEKSPNRALARFIQTLLRTVHADAFAEWWPFDVRLLEKRTRLSRARVLKGLGFLAERGLIDWQPPGAGVRVELLHPRTQSIPIDGKTVLRARQRAERRLDDLLRYAHSIACRRQQLLAYFGERAPERCGKCDVCLGRHRPPAITPEDEPLLRRILQRAYDEPRRADWFADEEDPASAQRLDALVAWLVEEGYLRLDDPLEERFGLTGKARKRGGRWRT